MTFVQLSGVEMEGEHPVRECLACEATLAGCCWRTVCAHSVAACQVRGSASNLTVYHKFSTINDLSHYSSTYGCSGTDSGFFFSNLHFPQAVYLVTLY